MRTYHRHPTPPSISKANDLASTLRTTTEEILQAASLQAVIAPKKQSTLGALLEAVTKPAATLLHSYVKEGIPATTGPS